MNEWVARRLVLPLALLLRGESSAFAHARHYAEMESWDESQLKAYSQARLKRILSLAASTPGYIARLESSGVEPSLDDFTPLDKTTIQRETERFLNPQYSGRRSWKTTGGSTGEPVSFAKNPTAIARERGASMWAYERYGIRPGARGVRMWGDPTTGDRKLKYAAADLAMNRIRMSAFGFAESDLAGYWDQIRRFRPRYLYGYASMLEMLARHVLNTKKSGNLGSLVAVVSTSEALTEASRSVMEDAFGVRVWNEYGCGEIGPVAYECEERRMHILSPNVHVEALDSSGTPVPDGALGELVFTDLGNEAMPVVRYRSGDIGRLSRAGRCVCGLPFPVLDELVGRKYDFVEDASGSRYHGEAVMYLFEDLRAEGWTVRRFQVEQEEPGSVIARVVSPDAGADLRKAIRDLVFTRLGGMTCDIEEVDQIRPLPSGKTPVVIGVGR